ncbi:CoA transferase [Fulvivirgaceae bacterium PWU4]|uniref:CoA transferase n=1 Tax=Chryseosolibacter histidini TaxID=2782349 RepID=A0AAP2DQ01_9BACT|nr:CaiB/BaiF CoA-transferase family protein [Chryseosolibacter histidini]MBT1698204.1 CoA transferase [Chryseosolibacter histidini]
MSQLKGYKVLELASVLAGPAVGQFFAELGAEVIKVENLTAGGDVTRSWKSAGEKTDDRSAYFCAVNWGKRSIAIDLNTIEGKNIVQKLARRSDIVIASYKPGDAEKLGVDYKTLSQDHPDLIYGQISGYGAGNPRVGYDAIIQAETGFMFMNGEPGGPSLKMPVALVDVLAGHQLKEGLLLAMLERVKTGRGKLVEVSLIQAAAASLVNQASNWLVAHKLPQKQGSAHPNIAPYGEVFTTADGKELIMAVGSDQQFRALCKLLDLNEVAGDHRYSTNALRVENRKALAASLTARISTLSSQELMPKIHAAKIPAGIIQDMSQVFQMEEVKQLVLRGSGLQGVRTYVAHASPDDPVQLSAPPKLGEHTDEIIRLLDSGL